MMEVEQFAPLFLTLPTRLSAGHRRKTFSGVGRNMAGDIAFGLTQPRWLVRLFDDHRHARLDRRQLLIGLDDDGGKGIQFITIRGLPVFPTPPHTTGSPSSLAAANNVLPSGSSRHS